MKKHIITLLIVLGLIITYLCFLLTGDIYNITTSIFGNYTGLPDFIEGIYFKYHLNSPPNLILYIFVALKAFAYLCLIIIIGKACHLLLNMIKEEVIYKDLHQSFKKIGVALVRFSIITLVIYLFFGTYFYSVHHLHLLISHGPLFFSLFLIGKVLVISSFITEKGESYKTENDLTV